MKYVQEALFNLDGSMLESTVMKHKKTYAFPYFAAPVVTGVVMYFAVAWGNIRPSVLMSPWMLPGPLGAYLASGQDLRAVVASLICVVVSMILYFPSVMVEQRQNKGENV